MSNTSPPDLWQKVLVPTDFSASAEAAIRAAAAMQARSALEVVLLHVTEPAYEGLRVQTGDLHEQMRREAESQLKQVAASAFADGAKVRVQVGDGRAADVICKTAKAEKVDAIIIPSHGRSGLAQSLLGSVTDRVVRHAPCNVLVVRE